MGVRCFPLCLSHLELNITSPFARYYSDANSFPDYRAPSGKMGLGNVKSLNRSGGPVNTFHRQSASDPRATPTVAPAGPSAKRQKIESPSRHAYTTSRFFTKKSSRALLYDLSQDGSLEDPYDLKSTSSVASYQKPSIHPTIPEFRNAQPKNRTPSRRSRRRRRRMPPNLHTEGSVNGSGEDSLGPDSPDVLAIDNGSPPPANIISDIASQRGPAKRARQPSFSGPQVKRPKPAHDPSESIEVSEDELQAASKESRGGAAKRRTNFSGLEYRSPTGARSRGDLASTDFRSSKTSKAVGTKTRAGFSLKKAVCGSNIFCHKPTQQAKLVPQLRDDGSTKSFRLSIQHVHDETTLENPLEDEKLDVEESIPWLQIIPDKIQAIEHHATHSPFVRIRKRTAPGAPPVLILLFDSKEDALKFVGCIPTYLLHIVEPERLEKMFHVAMTKASEQTPANGDRAKTNATLHTSLVVDIPEKLPRNRADLPKKEKLTDKMLSAERSSTPQRLDLTETPESPPVRRNGGRETRRTRQSSPKIVADSVFHFPDAWTLKNPNWQSQWHKSLVFPATGKNRATVDAEDIKRLDEGEFLNDNLISFYLRYLQVQLEKQRPEVLDKVYIFSSFFFDKLKTSKTRYEGVRGWTAKVDLFSYDYIVVPVNEHAHWYLAIICNVGRALPSAQGPNREDEPKSSSTVEEREPASPRMPAVEERIKTISLDDEALLSSPSTVNRMDNATTSPRPLSTNLEGSAKSKSKKSLGGPVQRFDPTEPKIITLDSLGSAHSPTCKILREYLAEEAKDKKGVELAFSPSGMTGKGIPEQDNFCDCGVFVLGYMEEFLKDPDEVFRRLLQKEPLKWDIKPSRLRQNIRNLLFSLQKEQQERLDREREEKKQARRRMKAVANSQLADPSTTAPSATSSQEPPSRHSIAQSQDLSPSVDLTGKESTEPTGKSEVVEEASIPEVQERPGAISKDRPEILDGPEPKLISRLNDDEDTPNSDDQSPDTFYSAPSSPSDGEQKVEQDRATKSESSARGRFVERILSSGSEDNEESKKTKALIRSSIEVEDDEPTLVPSPRRPKSKRLSTERPSTVSPYVEVRDSVEPDVVVVTKGPRYDGIERS